MNNDERIDLTTQAFRHTLAGDLDQAADVLERIDAGSTSVQMFSVCCAFASGAAHALRTMRDDLNLPPGPVHLKPEGADVSPPRLFARRFIVAFTNRDHPMIKALYTAALEASDDEFAASVAALLLESAEMHKAVCPAHG